MFRAASPAGDHPTHRIVTTTLNPARRAPVRDEATKAPCNMGNETGTLPHVELSSPSLRVLGCLIEKQRTTPNAYPLTLNSVRTACNQASNRDPVVDYSESQVQETLKSLQAGGFVRLVGGAGHRVTKYRQVLDEALGLNDAQISVMAVLMLRGPQTPGEIKQRTERLHAFGSLTDVDETLDSLVEFEPPLVTALERQPGRREIRYQQLLGEQAPTHDVDTHDSSDGGSVVASTSSHASSGPAHLGQSPDDPPSDSAVAVLSERVAALEAVVERLDAELRALQDELI